ncbi:unnamed protein product [marine sediment metagenome]|uniref:Uncharacterized protein n=1 Tax=marine sediment metagenome TaxID=412755 RepID=X1CW11_9ZZZZ
MKLQRYVISSALTVIGLCGKLLVVNTLTWMKAIGDASHRTSLFGRTHLHPHKGDIMELKYILHTYCLDDISENCVPGASTRVLIHITAEWKK